MTKPIGDPPAQETPQPAADTRRARRRLGDWQLGVDTGTGELDFSQAGELDSTVPAGAHTAPIERTESTDASDSGHFGRRLRRPVPAQLEDAVTARFAGFGSHAESDQDVTAPLHGLTARIAAETLPFTAQGAAQTEAISPEAVVTAHVSVATAEINDVTVQLQNRHERQQPATNNESQTVEISAVTARIDVDDVRTASINLSGTADIASGEDSPDPSPVLTRETLDQIDHLQEKAKRDPSDSDALFELSILLHRAGLRKEARGVLTKLVALYEQRGQHQQAARIKGMLGAPKTGPIETEALTVSRPALAPTAPFTAQTSPVRGGTAALRGATTAFGRSRESARAKAAASVHAFPPESMIFTIPLPGEETLPAEARAILRQCDSELRNMQLLAAFDSCVELISLVPDYIPVHLRLAEICTKQRLVRRARMQAEALIRLAGTETTHDDLWMVYRVLLHANGGDTPSLKRLVELLIDAGQTEQASFYASRLIQILDAEGLNDEALAYSIRLCELIPGDTRAALENAILRIKGGDRGGALDRWESAVAAGADPVVARSSIAALTTLINEDDHWRILSEVIPAIRSTHDQAIIDAYARTAAAMPDSATLQAGHGLMLIANNDMSGRELLAQAAGSRSGAPISRASAAISLAWTQGENESVDKYVAAVRTALKLLQDNQVANHPAWEGLAGRVPRFEDLSLELGEVLLTRGDAAGAAEVLKEAHARARNHGPICERLAEAYFKIGQLGSALTVLDELAVHFRASGQLEAMAGVLRQMSQLAPNNIKVKSRLIDAYLQRGFVAEARAELIQRADLEERSGLIKDAVASLQKAAELSWTIGLAEETFALYTRVIAMAPDDVGNRSSLVNYYLQMGRLTEAAEHQRAVVDIALKNDHKHEAIAALHQVIGLTPDDTSAYYQLAELLGAMGEYHQAERVYRRLVLMNPADPIAQAKATSMASLSESRGR